MNTRILTAVSAAPSFSQEKMLEDSVAAGMISIGVDISGVKVITPDQAAQIENVLSSTDKDTDKKARIEQILGFNSDAMATDAGGILQIQNSVSADMTKLGLSTDVLPTLSFMQLSEIKNITGSSDGNQVKLHRINAVFDGTMENEAITSAASKMLMDSVLTNVSQLGIATDTLPNLTVF